MRRITTTLLMLLVLAAAELHATGALYVRALNSSQTYELMNIRTYDATVVIQDQIAVTHVDQVFRNTTSNRVEATFIFPLPEGAVITELIYWFNGRKYVASLRERKEAQQAYNDKVRRLIDPALLQYFGENLFKLNIAPIDAQSDVRFEITYAELLPYEFGAVGYRFPLKTTGLSPQPLERVSVKVDATTSRTFRSFTSPSHGNTTANGIVEVAPDHYTVSFGDENYLPDRDLTLRFETRRSDVDINVLTYVPMPADSFGVDNFYAMWVTPPDSLSTATTPRNIIFTADISSSMEGKRIEQLKQALTSFLGALDPRDRFNIVTFSTNAVAYRPDLVQAVPGEIAAAQRFVDGLGAVGLTNIDAALRRSLAMTFGDTTANVLVFMTDGLPTWGEQNLTAIADSSVARNGGRARIFTFGIGEEVSKPLLDDIAKRNGGYPTYIGSDDSIAAAVVNYFNRISQPVLTDLALDFGGLATHDRYSDVLGNLFWGSQVIQFGRYTNDGTYTLTLNGMKARTPVSVQSTAFFSDVPGGNRAVARLWAKYKIDYLLNEIGMYGERKELVDAVIDLSMRFGILTPYTALYSDPDAGGSLGVDNDILAPARIVIEPAFPNPFAERTQIAFILPPGGTMHAVVAIYDAAGRRVRTLLEGDLRQGRHQIEWDGTDERGMKAPAGIYLLRVETIGGTATQRVVRVL